MGANASISISRNNTATTLPAITLSYMSGSMTHLLGRTVVLEETTPNLSVSNFCAADLAPTDAIDYIGIKVLPLSLFHLFKEIQASTIYYSSAGIRRIGRVLLSIAD
eukprot:IDg18775t1